MRISACTLLTGLLLTAPALAVAEEGPRGPYFVVDGPAGVDTLPLRSTRADFTVAGVIARVRLRQVYENRGSTPIEAVYVFPKSTGGAVHAMRLRIGERTLEAKIESRVEARRTYDRAKEDGRQAGLLEQDRPNVLSMRVANIRPGDRIEVEVDYSELMSPTEGTYELVIPSVVGPRFTGESREPVSWAHNPHLQSPAPAPFTWDVSGKLLGGLPVAAVRSPSHAISPRFLDPSTVGIEVDDEAGGDRDFVLRYRLGGAGIESGLLLHDAGDEQFFLLNVAPPKRVAASHVVPREYVFVVDVSGSMGGFPIRTAKKLLRQLVGGLGPQDRFNVVLFAGGSHLMSPQNVPPTGSNLEEAARVIDGLRGGGGTRLLEALERAFALPRDDTRSTSFVLVTDGFVSVEKEALETVSRRLGEANLFTFGIGKSVNRHLVESLARAGRGEPFVVLDADEAPTKAQAFLRYIEQPVLTNVEVSFDGFDVEQVEPKAFADLFASRPITVFGKYRGQPSGRVTVRGRAGGGEYTRTIEVGAHRPSDDLGALRYLWARHRVERLSDLDAISGDDANADQITRIGLRYSLLTKHTSFVAVSKQRVLHGDETAAEVRQPLPMPSGVPNAAVGGGMLGVLKGSTSVGSYGVGGLGTRGTGRGGGGSASVSNVFGPGAGKIGTKKPARISAGAPMIMGSLDKDVIRRVIRQHRNRVRQLYEHALKSNPTLSGRIVVKLVIGADGRVERATLHESTLKDDALERRLLKILRTLRFPKPKGGGKIIVKYPFVFRPS